MKDIFSVNDEKTKIITINFVQNSHLNNANITKRQEIQLYDQEIGKWFMLFSF